ncbi:MAG: RNA-binding S4 domain-containing protein [Ruminococcaceae bacterium]|nr:RNA-binding S4 domain-containing protein [Oscillospiraceae bacterium]
MRLDKFLKVSRLIKRRTVANEACEQGKIKVNDKVAKPAADVKVGDILELTLGERVIRVEVMKIAEHTLKEDAADLYRVL